MSEPDDPTQPGQNATRFHEMEMAQLLTLFPTSASQAEELIWSLRRFREEPAVLAKLEDLCQFIHTNLRTSDF